MKGAIATLAVLLMLSLAACKPSAPAPAPAPAAAVQSSKSPPQTGASPLAAAAVTTNSAANEVTAGAAPAATSAQAGSGNETSAVAANDGMTPVATVIGTDDPQQLAPWDEQRSQREIVLGHVGKVAIGDHLDALTKWSRWTTYIEAIEGCQNYKGTALPEAIGIMTWNNVVVCFELAEYDVAIGKQLGAFGLRVGMSREQVVALLPDVPVSGADDYNGDMGEYLAWLDPHSDLGIRLEMLEGRLIGMYWGRRDAIQLAEGCA
jgi:hypothetical protein